MINRNKRNSFIVVSRRTHQDRMHAHVDSADTDQDAPAQGHAEAEEEGVLEEETSRQLATLVMLRLSAYASDLLACVQRENRYGKWEKTQADRTHGSPHCTPVMMVKNSQCHRPIRRQTSFTTFNRHCCTLLFIILGHQLCKNTLSPILEVDGSQKWKEKGELGEFLSK